MKKNTDIQKRMGIGGLAILLIFMGLSGLLNDHINYSNYWGGVVFAPVALILGILVLFIVIFRWDSPGNSDIRIKKKK